MSAQDPIAIVGSARTPMGSLQDDLKNISAPALGATAIKAAVSRAGVPTEEVQEVVVSDINTCETELAA